MNNWDSIRAHYAKVNHLIKAAKRNEWACDPYLWDAGKHMIFMTPIEENFWDDCREADLILYPQYPACGYFIDFANPAAKVGIECDGRAFHADKARDERRQGVLEDNGWTIYRIGGRECNENWSDDSSKAPAGRILADQIGRLHNIKRREADQKGARHVGAIAASILDRVKAFAY